MLIGACQLVKKSCLAAVLISDKSKGELSRVDLLALMLDLEIMRIRFLTDIGVGNILYAFTFFLTCKYICGITYVFNFYLLGIGKSYCKFISAHHKLHWISHRSKFYKRDFSARNKSHIEEMLSECAASPNGFNRCCLADLQFS